MIRLRDYQELAKSEIFTAWDSNYKNVLLVIPTGGGKCLGKDTPVIMYDGTIKKVQDVQYGDLLLGPDSKPRKVLNTCIGVSDLYEIEPVKGDKWVCNDVHVLTLKHTQTNKIIDIDLPEYLKSTKNFKHCYKQFRVGVDFQKQEIIHDPYLVGLYLAEGSKTSNHLTTPEPEIINFLKKWSKKYDHNLSIRNGNNCKEIGFSTNARKWNGNLIKHLRTSCITETERFIPKEYLINTKEIRLQVLAGLLDGDGYLGHNSFEIITKYKRLNEDILYLCRSLGLAAYSNKSVKKIKNLNFEAEYYRICISGHTDMIPNIVKRKKAKKRKQIKDVLKTGIKVNPLGKGTYYGFELDGDGRFLLGDFTVTHNTKTFCSLVIDTLGTLKTAIMVHRKELVQQICLTLAEEEIPHNIIASRKDIRGIIAAERRMFGKQFYNPHSQVSVISVDTLNARHHIYKEWCKGIQQWITDEAAHVLKENKWGKAISYFENARGLGVTATPERLDKKGLGSHADGVFDTMVEGPTTRYLIDNQYLSKYKIAIPESDYNHYLKKSSSNSDYSKKAMAEAARQSHIVGDVVQNYLQHAKGKQAILFAPDIGTAKKMEKEFNDAGIVAKELNGCTNDSERLDALVRFREKEIKVLINVDLFDEGLDVPGIECVIMARPTKSLGKYLQMVGRGLRIAEGKPYLILIDHVGNVMEHGLPCKVRNWTLDRIKKRGEKTNFLRICGNIMCNSPYDRALTHCPWCGEEAVKKTRDSDGSGRVPPKVVDGDLFLIDPETIRELESKAQLEDPGSVAKRVSKAVNGAAGLKAMKQQAERIKTQGELVQAIAIWAGKMKNYYGYKDRSIHKKFYLQHGKTITEALGESRADMQNTIDQLGWEM